MKNRMFKLVLAALIVLGAVGLAEPVSPALAQAAWYGEYFANRDLVGGPVFTRYDNSPRFHWDSGSPGVGIPADNFSVRWTRTEWFEAGTHRFSYRSDDGIRIWIDGVLVVNDWRDRQAAWNSVDHYVSRGNHAVRVDYFEHTGTALVEVSWERISGGAVWRGEYFDNRKLAGAPKMVRYDAAVDFAWKDGSPDAKIPADDFSARWTRALGFTAGTYRFYASCDDGVSIFVDGSLVVDAWRDQKLPNTRTGDIYLSDGQHNVVVEYYDHGGQASAHVWWKRLGAFVGWEGRYYDNAELRGGPALVRDDAEINFDWGESAPVDWMPDDNFSAVWTRSVVFSPGYYRLNAYSDDGVRVWLDDGLVMDYWKPQEYEYHYVDGVYLEGTHELKVAYFERTGLARIQFWWKPAGTAPPPAAPTPAPAPPVTPAPAAVGAWRGEYFNNTSLSGLPVVVRDDTALNFNWGWSAPVSGVSADNFSVRWNSMVPFEAGRYRFTTTSDDGVRVYVDGQRVIDAWIPMHGTRSGYADLVGGSHTVRVEYFERLQAAMVRLEWQRIGPAPSAPITPAPPTVCTGGPLRLEAWPVDQVCTTGGWKATVYARAYGGDCLYTYAWEGQTKGGPTSGPVTFELRSAHGAMVGTVSAASAGQVARVGLYIRRPSCD
jgi:hypothetical protein